MKNLCGALVVVLLALPPSRATEEVVDRIVAVVERDVILQSEIDEFVRLQVLQSGKRLESLTAQQQQEMRCEVLNGMIDDRLLVTKARADSVEVSPQEVETKLRDQLENIKQQFPNEEAYREQLRLEGTTERDLRNKLRVQMERYLLRERLMQQLGLKISVTFNEVERFFEQYRDSLPDIPASVTFTHITRESRAGDSSLAIARQRIRTAQERLAGGEDFAAVAKELSQDPGSAPDGGDLGYFGRGQMLPEFETAAFALDSGQTGSPVLTKFGIHLIQNTGFRGDEVRARHILALARPGPADNRATRDTMMAVYRRLAVGEDFAELARTYSMDPLVRQTGGRIGPIDPDLLPASFGRALATLEVGEVSEPFESEPGNYSIVKLLDRTRGHRMNLTDDRRQIEEAVRQRKLISRLEEILDRERERVYVDMRLEDCPIRSTLRVE